MANSVSKGLKFEYFDAALNVANLAVNLVSLIPGVELPKELTQLFGGADTDPTVERLDEMSEQLDQIVELNKKVLAAVDEVRNDTYQQAILNWQTATCLRRKDSRHLRSHGQRTIFWIAMPMPPLPFRRCYPQLPLELPSFARSAMGQRPAHNIKRHCRRQLNRCPRVSKSSKSPLRTICRRSSMCMRGNPVVSRKYGSGFPTSRRPDRIFRPKYSQGTRGLHQYSRCSMRQPSFTPMDLNP